MNDNNIPYYFEEPEEENVDIRRYISLFLSNWYWFAAVLLIAVVTAYGINRYSEKVYTVTSTLLINDDQNSGGYSSSLANVLPGGDIFRSQQNLLNEMGILRSYTLNYKVMEELPEFHVVYVGVGRRGIVESRMYQTAPFKVLYEESNTQPNNIGIEVKILSNERFLLSIDSQINNEDVEYSEEQAFGERFNKYGFDFTVVNRFPGQPLLEDDGSNTYWFYFTSKESLAVEYKNKLSVAPIEEEASLVTLSVSGVNARQEADYLNKLMDVYIRYGLENKNQTADSTIRFIEQQLSVITDSLSLAEAQLESFRKDNRFIDISREGSYIQTRLERFESERATLVLQQQYYEYLAEYLEEKYADGTIISPSVMGITDQVLIRLVSELSEAQKQVAQTGFNLNSDQRAYTLVTEQVEQTRQALQENVSNGLGRIKLSIAEVEKNIDNVEQELAGLPSTERQLINIERNFDLNNTVYTYLLEKRSESEIARASNVSDNRIIDKADFYSTTQIAPKERQNMLIAIILGFAIPAVVLIILDFLNDKILDKKDVERKTKVPVIGYIAHSEGDDPLPVVAKPGSSLSESFRSVRTAIKYYVKENQTAVIAVSSTVSAEGKSFVSANLASIIAMLGKKVLVVGLDLRKPRLGKLFNYHGEDGMSTFLSGNSEYDTLIQTTQVANLFFAPAGSIPPNPSELIEGEWMKEFVDRAKSDFDYIIFDTPPVGIVTDTLLLTSYVDVNLFVVRQRYTSRNTLELVDQLNEQGQMKNLAIVLNDIKVTGYYGYGVRYGGYYHGYGYHYGYNYYGKGYYGKYGYNSKKNEKYYSE